MYDAAHPRANGGNNAFLPAFGAHLGAHLDLDDTLYDNRPVILRTEREALPLCKITIRRCAASRMKICTPAPGGTGSGTRDLSRRDALRFRSIEQAMLDAGLSAEEARQAHTQQ